MKSYRWIIIGSLASLIAAVIGYFWANGLMDSLYAYRSPFKDSPIPAGAPLGSPLSKHVVAVLVDGLRVDTAANPQVMPYLNQLRAEGASAVAHSQTPSYSAPGYSVLMTGAWPDLSDGPAMNPDDNELPPTWTQDNLFTAAHRAGLKTAVSGFHWFKTLIPAQAVDASFFTTGEDQDADRQVVDAALPWIQSGDYQFLLIHIEQVDYAGHHQGGPRDPRWNAAASRADQLIQQIVSAMDLKTDTVAVFSDHGHIDAGGHGGQEKIVRMEPFILTGAGVKPGAYGDVDQADIAPTLAVLLGTNIPAAAQGHALAEMLTLSDAQLAVLTQASIAQQQTLYEAYAKAMKVAPVQIQTDPSHYPVTVYQSAMESIKNDRLNRERLPRFILAIIIALIPAFFLFKNRGKAVPWLLLGAAVYLVVFHVHYALIQRRTYSLSSVASSDDIINTTAIDAAIAFVIAWLVIMFVLRLYSKKPLQAANTHIAFTWTLLYIVALPILWSFAYNGALVTWTLPDMGSAFMMFLSILQALILAALGLVFTGITPLVSLVFNKR